jgi:hypothetical protein
MKYNFGFGEDIPNAYNFDGDHMTSDWGLVVTRPL